MLMRFLRFSLCFALCVCFGSQASFADETTPMAVKRIGGYYVGGKEVIVSGLPVTERVFTQGGRPTRVDPNGAVEAGQMYVQYVCLAEPKGKYPVMLWHGGGLAGSTWEDTPDGRAGWQTLFLREGYDVYVSDSVERGRASWARFPEINTSEPLFRAKRATWVDFRIGPDYEKRVAFPDTQFPVEAFDQFNKQTIPRWATSDPMILAAYDQYIKQFPEGVILIAHSQAGNFALRTAIGNSKNIKALVLLEPSGAPKPDDPNIAVLKDIPQLFVWGDHLDATPIWTSSSTNARAYFDAIKKAGATADWVDLPSMGHKGNTHMLYIDKNSAEIARIVQDWLKEQGMMHPEE